MQKSLAADEETTGSHDPPAPAPEEGTRITAAPDLSKPPSSARPASGKSGVRPRPGSARAPASARPSSARPSSARAPASARPAPARPSAPPRNRAAEAPAPVPPGRPTGSYNLTGSGGGSKIAAPEEVLGDLWQFIKGLGTADKLAFLGAAATVLFGFLPWKVSAAEGDVLGLMSLGFVAVLGAVITMTALAIRTRRLMPNLNPVLPWLAQLASAGFCILWCAVYMKLSTNGLPVHSLIGNQMIPTSQPEMGAYLAILSSLVSLVGTLLGLKEKPA